MTQQYGRYGEPMNDGTFVNITEHFTNIGCPIPNNIDIFVTLQVNNLINEFENKMKIKNKLRALILMFWIALTERDPYQMTIEFDPWFVRLKNKEFRAEKVKILATITKAHLEGFGEIIIYFPNERR